MKSLSLFTAIALAITAGPTLAQDATPSPRLTVAPEPMARRLSTPGFLPSPSAWLGDGVNNPARRTQQSAEQRMALQNASPARLDRAQRIADLINSGECAEASALVSRENDRRLARRVVEICQGRN